MFRIAILVTTLLLTQSLWARGKYSIIQGTTSGTVTHFTVVAPKDHVLNFEVTDAPGKAYAIAKVEEVGMSGSDWTVRRIRVENLDPKTEYVLLVKDQNGTLEEARSFAMINPKKKSGKIGVASCMLRFLSNNLMWENMRLPENRPDVFFFIGDQAYLDRGHILSPKNSASPLEAWEEFAATRNAVEFYFWDHLVPVFSIWDDHDSGGNNVTAGNYPLMPEIHKVYDVFFPNEPIVGSVERGPGLSLNFNLFGQNIIMFDGRSFRDLDSESPMFGQQQEQWAFQKLQPGSNVLVNGSQFFGKYLQKDSYEFDYPEQHATFVKNLADAANIKGARLTFVSGDVHFSELQNIEPSFFGYPTYEITSSPAHSMTFPGRHLLTPYNPRRIVASSTHNIVNLEIDDVPGEFSANVKSISWRGLTLFERHLHTAHSQIFGPTSRLIQFCKQARLR
jgi:hypothetical protein